MKTVIKKMFAVVIILSAVSGLYAQQNYPAVDLSITISALKEAAESGADIPEAGTAVILNGTVLERKIINAEKETYLAELVLASGEWIGSESVVVSKCIIRLPGPEFADSIPVRRSRNVNPKEISLNSEMLIYGFFTGFAETETGRLAVIEASGVRKL